MKLSFFSCLAIATLVDVTSSATVVGYCNSTWSITFSGYTVTYPEYKSQDFHCIMKSGASKGSHVKTLQTTLNKCYGRSLTVDGIYGPNTKSAVTYAQNAANTDTDGVYGPNTAKKIKWYGKKGSGGTCHTASNWHNV